MIPIIIKDKRTPNTAPIIYFFILSSPSSIFIDNIEETVVIKKGIARAGIFPVLVTFPDVLNWIITLSGRVKNPNSVRTTVTTISAIAIFLFLFVLLDYKLYL